MVSLQSKAWGKAAVRLSSESLGQERRYKYGTLGTVLDTLTVLFPHFTGSSLCLSAQGVCGAGINLAVSAFGFPLTQGLELTGKTAVRIILFGMEG